MKARTWGAWTFVALSLFACGDVDPVEPLAPRPHDTTGSSAPLTSGVTLATVSATEGPSGSGETMEMSTGMDDTTGAPGPCELGSEGCPCTAAGACDPGLTCLSMICVDAGPHCPVGREGCPCTMNGTCDPGLECLSNVCVNPS
jgi:hypothetical protein